MLNDCEKNAERLTAVLALGQMTYGIRRLSPALPFVSAARLLIQTLYLVPCALHRVSLNVIEYNFRYFQ